LKPLDNRINFSIPPEALHIINTLNAHGFEAYAVGGCVRDSILGRKPQDWDITTNAKPHQIKGIFQKTVDTGIKHGTVTVLDGGCGIEVTTYRIDGEYKDNRRPESVQFTSSLTDDLSRRDFTINSIAYHPSEGIVDPFNGLEDIRNKTIRTVGHPDSRFHEDALRMLRAVRFSAQLDFEVHGDTLDAIKRNHSLIKNISWERTRDELTKLLTSEHPFRLALLHDTGLLQHVLPEFDLCFHITQNHPYHVYNVAIHTLHAVASIEATTILRWAMLLHDTGKAVTKTTDRNNIDHFYGHPKKSEEIAIRVLKRLRFDAKSTDLICRLIKHHDMDIKPTHKSVRRAVRSIGDDIFWNLLKVQEADRKAQNPEKLPPRQKMLNEIRNIYREIKESNQCLSLKELAIDGSDLLKAGFSQGPHIGKVLNRLLDAVIDDPELNRRDKLLELAKKYRAN